MPSRSPSAPAKPLSAASGRNPPPCPALDVRMDEVAVRLGIHELIAAYVDCIDEDRLEDWPEFFVEQSRYLVTSRASHEAGLPHGVIYGASRGMLVDRVTALRQANIFEPH